MTPRERIAIEALEKFQDHVDFESATITCPKMSVFIKASEALALLRAEPVVDTEALLAAKTAECAAWKDYAVAFEDYEEVSSAVAAPWITKALDKARATLTNGGWS